MRGQYYDDNWEPLSKSDYSDDSYDIGWQDEDENEDWEIAAWDEYAEHEDSDDDVDEDPDNWEYTDERLAIGDELEETETLSVAMMEDNGDCYDYDVRRCLSVGGCYPSQEFSREDNYTGCVHKPEMNVCCPEDCMDAFFSSSCDGNCRSCTWWMNWMINRIVSKDRIFLRTIVEDCYYWYNNR